VRKVLKILAFSLGGLLLLFFLVAGFTQTQFFRDRLRAAALSNLQSLVDAEIQLGNLTGNLINGFSIDHLSMKVQDDFLIVAERLDLRYDLFELPGKRISIGALSLVHPEVKLLRGKDGVWNFARMIRPAPLDTAAKTPFDWVLHIQKLEIREGTIFLTDSAALARPEHEPPDSSTVEYHRFALEHFNLSAFVRTDEHHVVISSLSFLSEQPSLRLEHFAGDFTVSSSQVVIKNVEIKTDRSDIRLDAAMGEVDLLGGVNLQRLQHAPVRATLRGHAIDLDELKRFIPQLGFLNGALTLDVEVDGEFGELNVKHLDLKRGATALFLGGTVYNLHEPGNLYLGVKCTESKLYSPDILGLLPGFNLPDYRSLGVATLNLEFEGKPLNFHTKFLLETQAGTIRPDVTLIIGGPATLKYKGDILARNVDLSEMLDNPRLASRLNGVIHLDGEGTKMESLRANCSVLLDTSLFMGQRVGTSQITLTAKERLLSSTVSLALGPMRSALTAVLDGRDTAEPSFTVEGDVSSLNLEDLLHERSFNSDLTMSIRARGTGLTWEKVSGDFRIGFSSSRYGQYQISADTVHLVIDQRDPTKKSLQVQSTIADFSLEGAYDVEYLAQLLSYETQSLRGAISERFGALDSTFVTMIDKRELAVLGKKLAAANGMIQADYTLSVKNLEPVSIVTGNRTFDGSGTLRGSIHGGYDRLDFRGVLTLEDFFYGDVNSGILVQDGEVTLDTRDLKPVEPLQDLDMHLVVHAATMNINRNRFDSLWSEFSYQQRIANYVGNVTYDTSFSVMVQGSSNVSRERLVFTLNDFQCAYRDFAWRADGGAKIEFSERGMQIRDLLLRREAQTLTLAGSLGDGGIIEASIIGSNLQLVELRRLLSKGESGGKELAFDGVAGFSVTAKGTLESPGYHVSLRAENVAYRTVPFGTILGEFSYADTSLVSSLVVNDPAAGSQGRPSLRVEGTLPIDLSLRKAGERLPDRPMDFTVRSDGIQMSILNPLVPTFSELTGMLRCDVHVIGSPRSPNYAGSMRIDSCSFLFVPNNIYYTFEGSFKPEGDRIKVLDATIKNVADDERFKREGLVHLAGDFALREFRPTDFNLFADGQLLVVKETTRKSELSVYGDLFLEIGPGKLHFTGEVENSLLQGHLTVRNSSLVFPPSQARLAKQSSSTLPLVIINDTAKVSAAGSRSAVARYFGASKDSTALRGSISPEIVSGKSFLDGVRYDLDIKTEGGNTELRMVFYTAPLEELVATIDGTFSITEDGKRWYGDLRIEKAYYNFYKRFDAVGTIRYSGDFLNPELDIQASYQGTRRVVRDTTVSESQRDQTEKVVVNLKITGTRNEPKLDISMTIDGEDYAAYTRGPKSTDMQSDALAFIITGTFPLTKSEKNEVASNIGTTVGASLVTGATSLLSGTLSEFLRQQTGFITSLELSYGAEGKFGEPPEIRLSGVAAGGFWRYGGKILSDPLGNANVSILYSFGDILDNPKWRNVMLELERKVESATLSQVSDRPVKSARLFYRISF
jgi:hypothetical protein